MGMTRWAVVFVGLLVLSLVPVWAAYGALEPGGDHGDMGVDLDVYLARSRAYADQHRLPDGSVQAVPDVPVPIAVVQYGFQPNVLRMRTGETYALELVAKDVTHGFSLQMGMGSLNGVVSPGAMSMIQVTPRQPGEFLFVCNEYCGIGHQFMSGRIVVEGEPAVPSSAPAAPSAVPGHGRGH